MSFTLDNVVPWGRSFDEYVEMFSLSADDLQKRILGCGDGPASFNATLSAKGGQVISVDPLYRFPVENIRTRIGETFEVVMEHTRRNQHEFNWSNIKSVEELGRIRMAAMETFLKDYPQGRQQGRYIEGELPRLPFADRKFDFALCSHFLFLYSEQFSEDFHVISIRELCRVAAELRIFPLLELGSKPSRHLEAVTNRLEAMRYSVTIEPVSYEFQRGGYQLMKIQSVET